MSKKPITSKEIEHIAKLANLSLTSREVKKFQKQLSVILGYVNQLARLNTQKVTPTSQITGLVNVFRKDEASPSLTQEEVLSGTKNRQNGLFKIKGIFEEE